MGPRREKRFILLVNPWIHDFAAYDFWMKPLGLLYLASILRSGGCEVALLDCLDFPSLPERYATLLKIPKRRDFGRGHFHQEVIPKPEPLRQIPRQYRRYGIPPEGAREILSAWPRPDLILITSSMTYWYTGLFETIAFLRLTIPGVPILLGGIYATLCFDHAEKYSGADRVLPGPWDGEKNRILAEVLDIPPLDDLAFDDWPYPAFDLYPRPAYVCLLTRRGCPCSCTYCAASILMRGVETRSPEGVVREILHWRDQGGIRDFAFYDDALLIHPAGHIQPILQGILQRGGQVNFHTPNALHAREIDEELAGLLFRGGFKTIRLGLETSDEAAQIQTGGKVNNRDFRRAVANLRKAGYSREEIGVYLMAGLPGQPWREVRESIAFVLECGARPILAEYSPIPGTPLFGKAKEMSPFDLDEPLFQNNSLFPGQWGGFTWGDFRRLKEEIRNL